MAWVGLDLGGTKIYGVVVDNGQITEQVKRPTPTEGGPEAVVEAMAAVVRDLGGVKHIKRIGVGAPGLIDRKTGVLKRAPNLAAWTDDFALGPRLESLVGHHTDVVLGNDVEVAVLGEHRMGVARGHRHVLGIWMGTGVGGGLIFEGEIYKGARGLAGEIGHIIVHPGGRRCGCGHLGHLESYAGRAMMERRARAEAESGRQTALVELAGNGRMKSGVFAKALEAKDPLTIELIDEAVDAVAYVVASLTTLLDFELVVLGGGMGERLGPVLAPRIEARSRPLMFVEDTAVPVVPAALGDASGAAGAALMAAEA